MSAPDPNRLFPDLSSVPEDLRRALPQEQTEYLVDGTLRRWDGPRHDVFSPVYLREDQDVAPQRIGSYPLLTAAAAREACDAAVRAFDLGRGEWPTMPVAGRIRHVEDFAARMLRERESVSRLLMWEIGKTRADAEKEFDRTIAYIRNTIDALKDLDRSSSRFVLDDGVLAQIRRSPLGVTLCLGPYNYPLNEAYTTLFPALLMGNCVVMKPPKLGVLLHRPLLEAFRSSFPPGVINVIYGQGREILPPLMASGRIDVLAFIGTSPVADELRRSHPRPHRLRCVLGLEAKNPAIILPDADLELAARECVLGALSFNGQRCTAIKMIFVHRSVAGPFLELLDRQIDALKAGPPWEPGVSLTALPEEGKPGYLEELIEDARAGGARVTNRDGGVRLRSYLHPAVLYPVSEKMRVYHEEQFGPVIPVAPFERSEEAIEFVVRSNYGQQVSLFGRDPAELARLTDPLTNQVCRVNLNSQCQRGPDTFPFTGRKDSAEGTLSVSDALRVFSIRTLVAAKAEEGNREILREILEKRLSSFLSTDFIF